MSISSLCGHVSISSLFGLVSISTLCGHVSISTTHTRWCCSTSTHPPSTLAHSTAGCLHVGPPPPHPKLGSHSLRLLFFRPALLQAPVPYFNRAIAKEALGVQAAAAGNTGRAQELWQSALQDCSRATELDPSEWAAWFDKGNVEMRLGDYKAALNDFSTAADLAPGLAGKRGVGLVSEPRLGCL